MIEVIEKFTAGRFSVRIYKQETEQETCYTASFQVPERFATDDRFPSNQLDNLSAAAEAADALVACHRGYVSVMHTAERLLALDLVVVRKDD